MVGYRAPKSNEHALVQRVRLRRLRQRQVKSLTRRREAAKKPGLTYGETWGLSVASRSFALFASSRETCC
jgi:hypothetical protein